MEIMAAHRIPYAATVSIGFPDDLMMKVKRAAGMRGTRFIHALSPCPAGWKLQEHLSPKVSVAAVETNVFPLYEIFDGLHFTINHESKNLPVEQVVSSYATNLALLARAGGRVFLLWSVPPLYMPPFLSDDAYVRSIDYQDLKARMDREVQKLQAEFGLTVFRWDMHDLSLRVWADPAAYGFSNITSAANACVGCDPNQYFFWDIWHPSAAAHRFISSEMYRCLTPPLVIAQQTGGASGVLDLQWQGGSPPFRLQRCVDLATGSWQSDEPTLATKATRVSSAPQQFFRVLQLGQ